MRTPNQRGLKPSRALAMLLGLTVLLTAIFLLQPTPSEAGTIYWICQSDSVCGGCGPGLVCARALIPSGSCCFVGGVQCRSTCSQTAPCHAFCRP